MGGNNLESRAYSLSAWDVLKDCELAFEMLETEELFDRFRVTWVAAIALVRAVGHVLHKIDGGKDQKLKNIIEDAHKSWKADKATHAIFWDFIEFERNTVLKQYEFGFFFGPIEIIVPAEDKMFELGDGLFCPIGEGIYKGEDCRDILEEAIQWWKIQLEFIETKYRNLDKKEN